MLPPYVTLLTLTSPVVSATIPGVIVLARDEVAMEVHASKETRACQTQLGTGCTGQSAVSRTERPNTKVDV